MNDIKSENIEKVKANFSRTKTFIAACIGMSFFGISMIVIGSVLPSLAEMCNFNTLQQAAIITFLPIGILIGSLVFGPICDKYGHRVLFFTSCFSVLIGMLGITFFRELIILQFFIFIIGLGGGVLNGQTNALVADLYDDKQRGAKLSLLGAFYGIGAIGIPLLTGLLARYFDFTIIIRFIGFAMLVCIAYCFTIRFPNPTVTQSFPIKQALGLLKQRALLLLSFILFFESGIEGACNNWTTTYLKDTTTINPALILQTLTIMVVALTVARLVLSVILKKFRQSVVLFTCFIFAFIGFGLMYVATNIFIAMLGMIFIGVGVSATYPVILNIIGHEYSALIGTAFGVAMTISLVGNTLINNVVGFMANEWGIDVYPLIMMCCIIAMIILYKIHSNLLITKSKKLC